jgi:hypothetical protein
MWVHSALYNFNTVTFRHIVLRLSGTFGMFAFGTMEIGTVMLGTFAFGTLEIGTVT